MLDYKVIEIFTNEGERWAGVPLYSAVVQSVRDLKIPARCIVTRGIEGCYETGEIATDRLEIAAYHMPVRIEIIVPATDCENVLSRVTEMVTDGIIAVRDVAVVSHKTLGLLMPRNTRVREIMTPEPKRVGIDSAVSEVARLLLSSDFTGLPVVDDQNRPVGIISQEDLINKAKLPIRFGLLASADKGKIDRIFEGLDPKRAREIMTSPAIVVGVDQLVTEAVDLMLAKNVKRLPVVDKSGNLVGNISRLDIFRTITSVCPDWSAFRGKNISVEGPGRVSDIMRCDVHTVLPDTPIEKVLGIIGCSDIQRVCVVDGQGVFRGLISDRDLLFAFADLHPGIWDFFARKLPFGEHGRRHRQLQEHLKRKTAEEVMNSDIVSVEEDTSIEEAVRLMLEKSLKRLPVLDSMGRFKGMVSRDTLLRTIFRADKG
jgi:CBS domain-containing protein